MTTGTPANYRIRPITVQDNAAIARVIRLVSAEFGLTADKGYTVSDPDLDHLFELYNQPASAYWVLEYEGEVVGGGGIAPLVDGDEDVCELQKCIFTGSARQRPGQAVGHTGAGFRPQAGFSPLLSGDHRPFDQRHPAV